jgi:hypothetical protein
MGLMLGFHSYHPESVLQHRSDHWCGARTYAYFHCFSRIRLP